MDLGELLAALWRVLQVHGRHHVQGADQRILEVPRHTLQSYAPQGTLTNEMRLARNFVSKFQERFARGELVVVRATRIVIPEQVLARSMAWFEAILQTAAENGATARFPFAKWEDHMRGLPGWVSMIENPWQDEVLDTVAQIEINDE